MKQKLKYLLLKLYPRIFGKNNEYALENKLCYIDTTQPNFPKSTKVDPWALIRVKNEAATLEACLNSIKTVIHKGVIVYNDCTDGSDNIILQFCKENTGFIPHKYEKTIKPVGKKLDSLAYEETLAASSNEALEIIPEGEWFIKIDADHIYFPEILEQSFYLPKNEDEYVSYSRLDILRTEAGPKVIHYRRLHDHLLLCKRNIKFINTITKHTDGKISYFERFNRDLRTAPYFPPCASLHFPYEKLYRKPDESTFKSLIPIKEFFETNKNSKEIPNFVNEEFINEISKKFHH